MEPGCSLPLPPREGVPPPHRWQVNEASDPPWDADWALLLSCSFWAREHGLLSGRSLNMEGSCFSHQPAHQSTKEFPPASLPFSTPIPEPCVSGLTSHLPWAPPV